MKKVLIISTLVLLINGCASIKVEPGAANVIASPNPPPKSCRYVGQIIGNQGNFFTGGFTSNRNLEEGAMNDLKNRAHKIGANYVQIITNRAGYTGSMSSSGGDYNYMSGSSQQTNITNMGNAYRCPTKSIGMR